MLQDNSRNLLRAALSGPGVLPFPLGATEERVRGSLALGYQEIENALQALTQGQWRFVKQSPTSTCVEVYFKPNSYGWTMLGLNRDRRRPLLLACGGVPGRIGYTLEEAAAILLQAGAIDALLID